MLNKNLINIFNNLIGCNQVIAHGFVKFGIFSSWRLILLKITTDIFNDQEKARFRIVLILTTSQRGVSDNVDKVFC